MKEKSNSRILAEIAAALIIGLILGVGLTQHAVLPFVIAAASLVLWFMLTHYWASEQTGIVALGVIAVGMIAQADLVEVIGASVLFVAYITHLIEAVQKQHPVKVVELLMALFVLASILREIWDLLGW